MTEEITENNRKWSILSTPDFWKQNNKHCAIILCSSHNCSHKLATVNTVYAQLQFCETDSHVWRNMNSFHLVSSFKFFSTTDNNADRFNMITTSRKEWNTEVLVNKLTISTTKRYFKRVLVKKAKTTNTISRMESDSFRQYSRRWIWQTALCKYNLQIKTSRSRTIHAKVRRKQIQKAKKKLR